MRELKVNIAWKDAYKKGAEFPLRSQEYGAPVAKMVFVSSHVLKLSYWQIEYFLVASMS